MWPRFGIKIGNSTLCIAYVKAESGKPDVIANTQGDRVSHAILHWDGADEIECGLTAKQKMAARPSQAVANSFQLLLPPEDLNSDKFATALKEIPCDYDATSHKFQLRSQADNGDEVKETQRQLSAYEVQVHLLRKELELARQYLDSETTQEKPVVVLSIPSHYPLTAWPQLANAAEEAGFHVAQVIREPTAAVLAYGIGENEPKGITKYVLTIKSGGLFSDFAIYAVRDGVYTQLDTYGPFSIGGRNYTDALVQFICEEFQRKYKLDPHESRRSMAKIRVTAADCKHILTTMPSTQIYIDSLMDGVDFNAQMSRARFESLIQPVIASFMQTLGDYVERALQQFDEIERIDSIVLLGSTMQIPKLQAAIAARYPDAQLHATLAADEVVAVGCARQATFLATSEDQDLQATDDCVCAEEELLIWHGNDESNAQVVIEKGAQLPSTVRLDVKLDAANADAAEIFRLRAGAQVNEVCLNGAEPTEDGVFQIEANINWREEADNQTTPVVRLRCV